MSLASRRGTSLAELLVALTMLGVVAAVLLRMLAGNLRLYHTQTQVIDRAQNLRSAAALLTTELRELSATDGDIYSATPTALSIRGMRRLGFVCAEPRLGATHVAIRQDLQFGSRDFDPATDSLFVMALRDTAAGWLRGAITEVRGGTCDDGRPARQLASGVAADPRFGLGAPVRAFESVTYRLYRAADGEWQIGLAAGGAVIQPLVGPVTASGLEFEYRNASGAVVSDVRAIAAIEIHLRMPTAQIVRGPAGGLGRSVDSLVTAVALRNNRRPPSPRWRRGGQGVRTRAKRGLNQRGVALVIAVFTLTVVGALVAAAFFAGVQEHRMSEAARRSQHALGAAEAQLSEVLRQWPDDDGSLDLYPRDSIALHGDSVILRRLGTDLFLVTVTQNALGLLVYRSTPCAEPRVDGVEMAQPNCYIDTVLQKMAEPRVLGSRAWVHLF